MLLWMLGCSSQEIHIFVTPDQEMVYQDFIAHIADERLHLEIVDDPSKESLKTKGWGISIVEKLEYTDGYLITGAADSWQIQGDLLGAQYGLADLLEGMNYRFYHPYKTWLPKELSNPVMDDVIDQWQRPDIRRRGLHLHTLHPIEGFYDFWVPSDSSLQRSKQVVDWMIKNRGNYIEWVALDNITDNPIAHEPWSAHTSAILEHLHSRGATAGIGVQLFGSGNLQRAFDLIDRNTEDNSSQIAQRIEQVLDNQDFDVLELSFGEFFEEEPQVFIDQIDQAYDIVQEIAPEIEMTTRIHVGDDLQVTYQGEEMIYYFLTQFANPEIVPWVHTVMYYNLFEPSNGAYHHEDFSEHREFLFERLENDLPVGYFPESAYWVAFDNSVPTYLPMYVRSRWLDLFEIKEQSVENQHSNLQEHILFSSGWEWGYWQNDVATLRMNYKIPDSYIIVFEELFSNYSNGVDLAKALYDWSEMQKDYLIDQQLDAYYCAVDNIMEIGYTQGIISQPKRPSFEEMLTMDVEILKSTVVTPLHNFVQAMDAISFPESQDDWQEEIQDGIAIDRYRGQYMALLMEAITMHMEGADPASLLEQAENILMQAQPIVDNRRQKGWDPNIERLYTDNINSTLYQYGYLTRASDLCYWHREMAIVKTLLLNSDEAIPGCGL